jgi:hypothetical protein
MCDRDDSKNCLELVVMIVVVEETSRLNFDVVIVIGTAIARNPLSAHNRHQSTSFLCSDSRRRPQSPLLFPIGRIPRPVSKFAPASQSMPDVQAKCATCEKGACRLQSITESP